MQEAAPSPAKDAVQSAEHGETPRLLSVLQMREDLPEGYASLLNRLVFCHEPPDHDQKSIQNLRRILATPEAYRAMFAIWSDALWSLPPKSLADAMRLAIRFEPHISPAHLARLPNYHAAGIVVRGSDISPPEVFATLPEPKAPRHRAAAKPRETGRSLAGARARLVRLIGERSAGPQAAL